MRIGNMCGIGRGAGGGRALAAACARAEHEEILRIEDGTFLRLRHGINCLALLIYWPIPELTSRRMEQWNENMPGPAGRRLDEIDTTQTQNGTTNQR